MTNCLLEGSHSFLVHREDPGCICDAGAVDEDPKKVEEVPERDVAVVEDAFSSDGAVVCPDRMISISFLQTTWQGQVF